MSDLHIRKLDPKTKYILKEFAKKKGVSLNAYICAILKEHAISPDVRAIDDKYRSILENQTVIIKEALDRNNQIIETNTNLILELEKEHWRK